MPRINCLTSIKPNFSSRGSEEFYSFSANTTSVDEGNTVLFTVSTQNVSDNTLYWTIKSISGNVNSLDTNNFSGSFNLTSNVGSFGVSILNDEIEETESFIVELRKDSTSGQIVSNSDIIIINDIFAPVIGEQIYSTSGTYTWVAPEGVTSVSVVCVGGGGGGAVHDFNFNNAACQGGGGGGLGWKNNISVVPGNSYTVVVGIAGTVGVNQTNLRPGNPGGDSYFINTSTVKGGGGGGGATSGSFNTNGGTYTGDGGGNGGNGGLGQNQSNRATGGAGGGAGGYSGNGGFGGRNQSNVNGSSGSGGGASGGTSNTDTGNFQRGPGGGGVGLLGQGSNGILPTSMYYGGSGGSGGGSGDGAFGPLGVNGNGGSYGGGGGSAYYFNNTVGPSPGAGGAVRIIWPGTTRQFPSTDVS